KANWIGNVTSQSETYYFPYKYKISSGQDPWNEYPMVLRLAEQYLIRAEARAHQNKLPEAIADLDAIRERAGLLSIANIKPGIGQAELLDAILQERRVELFAEWGHRWFDLKRTAQADAILGV